MTYNVHSCIGTDGRVNPVRVARVIERHKADIVALQELDSGLMRTGLVDQAKLLADMLEMDHYFLPSIHIETGQYGNAVLSRYPMRLFRAGELPGFPGRGMREKRGVMWLKLEADGAVFDVFNTHLGLNRHERLAQAMALTGPEWLRHPECNGPVIFCGDLNAVRRSRVYRILTSVLVDAPAKGTWPGRFPVMRIDYILTSPDIRVVKTMVPGDGLTRSASDHLPVLAVLDVAPKKESQ